MARKKEIDRNKILSVAYKMALKDGAGCLTARNIAKVGHFSTQPIYLEFSSMDELRDQVLEMVSDTLKTKTLQKKFIGKPLYDLDLSYIDFAKKNRHQFEAMFVNGRFSSKIISDTLLELGMKKFKKQFPNSNYGEPKILYVVISNWVTTVGLAALMVNQVAAFDQDQIVGILDSQLHDALANDNYGIPKDVRLFETPDINPIED